MRIHHGAEVAVEIMRRDVHLVRFGAGIDLPSNGERYSI